MSVTDAVARTVAAAVRASLLRPPEVEACCARCAQSGAAAACRCCDALPPDNAAEEASLLDEVVAPYSAYYGRVAARDALAAVDKALKKGA